MKDRGQSLWGTHHSWGRCQPQSIVSSSGSWNTDKNNWITEKKKKILAQIKSSCRSEEGGRKWGDRMRRTTQGQYLGVYPLSPRWTDPGEYQFSFTGYFGHCVLGWEWHVAIGIVSPALYQPPSSTQGGFEETPMCLWGRDLGMMMA